MIVEGRIAKLVQSEVGMLTPLSKGLVGGEPGFHIAHTLVTPTGRSVPICQQSPSCCLQGERERSFIPWWSSIRQPLRQLSLSVTPLPQTTSNNKYRQPLTLR